MKEVLVRCGVYFAAAFAVGFGAPLVVQVLLFVYQQVVSYNTQDSTTKAFFALLCTECTKTSSRGNFGKYYMYLALTKTAIRSSRFFVLPPSYAWWWQSFPVSPECQMVTHRQRATRSL